MGKAEANEAFVREFQARAGLKVDGWAGRDTYAALDVLRPRQALPAVRRLSERGLAFIEGFEAYRETTYPDPGPTGLPVTGGYGTTTDEYGKPFKLGVTHTREYWLRLKARDIARFEAAVSILAPKTTQGQFDALVSFAYNVGEDIDDDDIAEGLGDSTLLKKHNAGDYVGAAMEFPKWNKSKGKVLAGLSRRRAEEAELYKS
jgi:lysozyme